MIPNIPEKCQTRFRAVVYKEALLRDSDYVENMMKNEMRQNMADFIVNEKIQTRETELTKEYYLECYVLSYDELVRLIREEAMNYTGFLR